MSISGVTDKASALAFLDRLIADPLNPELCREFGIEVVPDPVSISSAPQAPYFHCCRWCLYTAPAEVFKANDYVCPECDNWGSFGSHTTPAEHRREVLSVIERARR